MDTYQTELKPALAEEKAQEIAEYILRDYDARLTQSMFKLIEELKKEQNARTS